jgi:ubiquinone/menaquinone biosynthesis C-methylase UbiE
MQKALNEIKRVLKANGLAYISEALFLEEQNELVAIIFSKSLKLRYTK